MNIIAPKCLHCGEEVYMDGEEVFDDIRAGKSETTTQCVHCNNIQRHKVDISLSLGESLLYTLAFKDIAQLTASRFSDYPADWLICRVGQVKFADDIDAQLQKLVLDYINNSGSLTDEWYKIRDYIERYSITCNICSNLVGKFDRVTMICRECSETIIGEG